MRIRLSTNGEFLFHEKTAERRFSVRTESRCGLTASFSRVFNGGIHVLVRYALAQGVSRVGSRPAAVDTVDNEKADFCGLFVLDKCLDHEYYDIRKVVPMLGTLTEELGKN